MYNNITNTKIVTFYYIIPMYDVLRYSCTLLRFNYNIIMIHANSLMGIVI